MIHVEHVSKSYRADEILKDIHVDFEPGQIYGLVGANGCGKTTLIRCICGFVKPTSGRVVVNGKVIGKDVNFAPKTGVIIETPGFLPHYSGLRNLLILAAISGGANKARAREVMEQTGLDPDNKKHVGKYSLGMRQRLGIAQAIMENPDILLLDEPFSALDKSGVDEMSDLLKSMRDSGKIIVISSHVAPYIEQLCGVVYEMSGGKLHKADMPESVAAKTSYRVEDGHLIQTAEA